MHKFRSSYTSFNVFFYYVFLLKEFCFNLSLFIIKSYSTLCHFWACILVDIFHFSISHEKYKILKTLKQIPANEFEYKNEMAPLYSLAFKALSIHISLSSVGFGPHQVFRIQASHLVKPETVWVQTFFHKNKISALN